MLPTPNLLALITKIDLLYYAGKATKEKLAELPKKFLKPNGNLYTKHEILEGYRHLAGSNDLQPFNQELVRLLQMKPVRTQSGVSPITVLTKPFPCPGKCIFCPNDIRMPKSYLADEPGAQRAERNFFDPYLQTYNRLLALHNIGHSVEKAELIILGGTWSYYPEAYQIWFIKECLRALSDFGMPKGEQAAGPQSTQSTQSAHSTRLSFDGRPAVQQRYQEIELKLQQLNAYVPSNDPVKNKHDLALHQIKGQDLHKSYNQVISQLYVAPERQAGLDAYQSASWDELKIEQLRNETAECRNVGMVIETRPDNISESEVIRIRKLGCTKTQIGFQSLNDTVLTLNHRGHDVAATRQAVKLLRQAGFKIHAHWMANLYGSSVEQDKRDFDTLFSDPDFRPDELKIYPCSLIESAELMQYFQRGEWRPYEYEELLSVLTYCMSHTPEYCRLTRVIRDIPSTDIVSGNKRTNFRELAESALVQAGQQSHDIRAREIRNKKLSITELYLDEVPYTTSFGQEIFGQYISKDKSRSIAGFVRLNLPSEPSFIAELKDAAMIRELHVYGQVVGLGEQKSSRAQHQGLGTKLLTWAKVKAKQAGFKRLAVISAIGTREYYRKQGFYDGELYQFIDL